MENIKKQQTSIDILAEMTRRDVERNLQIKETDNVTIQHSPRHGMRLVNRNKDPLIHHKVWQDDYK